MRGSTFSVLSMALMASSALAEISFNSTDSDANFNGVISSSVLSKDCATAYAEKLACSNLLFQLRDSVNGPALMTSANLKTLCTTDCLDALNDWDTTLNEKCDSDDKAAVAKLDKGVEYLSLVLQNKHALQENLYWAFCLKDEDKNDYCITRTDLPDFPTGNDTSSVVDFCESSCRTQQAYLINTAATDAGAEVDMYDVSACPNIDVSSFPMNVAMLDAFGTTGASNNTATTTDSNLIPGTTYEYTMYSDEFGSGNSSSSSNGTASVEEDTSAGVRSVVSWATLGLAVVVAAMI